MGATTTRKRDRSPQKQAELEDRKAAIELAASHVNDGEPDFAAFLARWGDRYNHNNLARLWVQAPEATCLHKYRTWLAMGRQVRKGERAILLMQPRTGIDPGKVSPDNPDGRVFYGASWMALFDYAQTEAAGEYEEPAPAAADPRLVEEVRRLRMDAAAAHPDRGGTAEQFMAAWARYEAARERLAA